MHVPEFSAEEQSCYRLSCWASTWIHGNSFHPCHLFSKASFTSMTKKIFLLLHIYPWSIEYFSSNYQSPKGHVSVCVHAGQVCLNSCHAALMSLTKKKIKKDLLLQLRSLRGLMTDVKPSKIAVWAHENVLHAYFIYKQFSISFSLLTSQQSPKECMLFTEVEPTLFLMSGAGLMTESWDNS